MLGIWPKNNCCVDVDVRPPEQSAAMGKKRAALAQLYRNYRHATKQC